MSNNRNLQQQLQQQQQQQLQQQQQQQRQQQQGTQQGTQTIRTYVNNPGVAAAMAMSQQQQNQQQPQVQVQRVHRGSGSGQGQGGSGSGNTTVIRPAPGTTTDVIIRRPGPDGRPPPLPVMPNVTQQVTSFAGTTQIPRKQRNRSNRPPRDDMGSEYGSLNSTTMLYPGFQNQYPGPGYSGGSPIGQYPYPVPMATYQQPQPYMLGPGPQYYGIGTIPTMGPTAYTTGPLYPPSYFQNPSDIPMQQQIIPRPRPEMTILDFGTQGDVLGATDVYGSKGLVPNANTRRLSDQEYMRRVLVEMQRAMGDGTRLGLLDPGNKVPTSNPPGFEVLYATENFFIDVADGNYGETYFDLRSKFDILDTYGDRLFYAAENNNSNIERSWCCASDPFKLSVIGCDGNEYMTVIGDSGAVGIRATLPDSNSNASSSKFLGYVVQDPNCCSINTDFIIKDRKGHTCFKILHEDSNPSATEFEIYGNDMMKIGRMSKIWAGLPKPDQVLAHTYGISFPRDMDVREKALMLTALFTVYFRFFADRTRDRRIARNAWITVILILVFFIAFVVGLVFLAVHLLRS